MTRARDIADRKLADNDSLAFGTGTDLTINHDGNNSFITDSGDGALYIQGTSGVFIRSADGGENLASFTDDGSVELYHDNTKRIETTSVGIGVDQIFGLSDTDTGFALRANGANIMQLYTANTERVNIDASGNTTLTCTAGDSNQALQAYHPTSTSARNIAKFQSNVGSTQADVVTIACDGDVTTVGGVSATGEITSTGSAISQNSNSIRTAIGNDGGSGSMGTSTNHALNIASNNTTRLQLTNDGVLGNFNGRNSAGIISSKTSITVDDDSSVTIIDASASQIAGRGMLLIYETSGGSGGTFTAGFGSATLLNTTNNFGTGADFVVGDTDNNFCVIVSGHELTFKNRIGSSRAFHIQFVGAGIT